MKRRFERKRLITKGADDGRTLQSQHPATNINNILNHYRKTGTFTHVAKELPQYGDFSNAPDYLGAMIQIKEAESMFMECSADVRSKFGNQVSNMLDFLADPENDQEAIDLGLAEGKRSIPVVQAEPDPSPPDADQAESPIQGGD